MNRVFWTSLCVFFSSISAGEWLKSYYDSTGNLTIGYSVQQTMDGGYILTGRYGELDSAPDILLFKTDSLGDTIWTRTYDSGWEDRGTSVQQTKEGDYIVAGHLSVEPCLIKAKTNGDTAWMHTYGYGGVNWVEQTSDGGFILTGRIEDAYLWILKTDKDGDTLWSKWYQWGTFSENGNCIRQTFDGGYILATNMGLLKADEKGDSVWMQPWISKCVEQTTDSGYILATEHSGDIWLIKTDENGDTLWTKTYGGSSVEESYDVHQTEDGGYVIFGNSGSLGGGWLLKTDSSGDTLWTRVYNDCEFYSGQQTSDRGYIITGDTRLFSEDRWSDLLLIKTDSLGYVGVEEPVTKPAQTAWQVVSPVGSTVTLRYTNLPQGLHALVFDASGRKVDEIQSQGESGILTWGQGRSPGVYFIKANSPNISVTKVVLLK